MAWRVKLSDSAIKSLEYLRIKEKEKIKNTLKILLDSLEEGKISFTQLNIRKLKGKWEGFLRIKVGKKLRIILRIEWNKSEVYVYEIDYRGKVYK